MPSNGQTVLDVAEGNPSTCVRDVAAATGEYRYSIQPVLQIEALHTYHIQ